MTLLPPPSRSLALLGALSLLLSGVACEEESDGLPPLQTVSAVDLERYLGTWYEIASYPQRFQEGCTATTATYSLGEDGIVVDNRCRQGTVDGELDQATGRARVVNATTNAELEVSFFGPFWGDYWIIDLGQDYEYAVVGHPGREYLWILGRESQLSQDVLDGILERLEGQHYDTGGLVYTDHG